MKKYKYSIEWFRGIAILFVVMTHVPLKVTYMDGPVRYLAISLKSLIGNGTFFFIFISGFLFHYLSHNYNYWIYLKKKAKYVILPYLVMILPALINWLISRKMLHYPDNESYNTFQLFIYNILVGGNLYSATPFWFIPMIALFFITSKLNLALAKNDRVFISILIPTLLFSYLSFRPDIHIYPVYCFFHFYGIYMLGIAASKYYFWIENNASDLIKYSFLLSILLVFIDLYIHRGVNQNWIPLLEGQWTKSINTNQLSKTFITLFIISSLIILERREKHKSLRMLSLLAKLSFGIFFIHSYVIQIWTFISRYLGVKIESLFKYFMLSIAVTLTSLISVIIIKGILKKNSRYVIGC